MAEELTPEVVTTEATTPQAELPTTEVVAEDVPKVEETAAVAPVEVEKPVETAAAEIPTEPVAIESTPATTGPDNIDDLYNDFVKPNNLFNSAEEFRTFIADPQNAKDFFNDAIAPEKLFNNEKEFVDFIGVSEGGKPTAGQMKTELSSQIAGRSASKSLGGESKPPSGVQRNKLGGFRVPKNLYTIKADKFQDPKLIRLALSNLGIEPTDFTTDDIRATLEKKYTSAGDMVEDIAQTVMDRQANPEPVQPQEQEEALKRTFKTVLTKKPLVLAPKTFDEQYGLKKAVTGIVERSKDYNPSASVLLATYERDQQRVIDINRQVRDNEKKINDLKTGYSARTLGVMPTAEINKLQAEINQLKKAESKLTFAANESLSKAKPILDKYVTGLTEGLKFRKFLRDDNTLITYDINKAAEKIATNAGLSDEGVVVKYVEGLISSRATALLLKPVAEGIFEGKKVKIEDQFEIEKEALQDAYKIPVDIKNQTKLSIEAVGEEITIFKKREEDLLVEDYTKKTSQNDADYVAVMKSYAEQIELQKELYKQNQIPLDVAQANIDQIVAQSEQDTEAYKQLDADDFGKLQIQMNEVNSKYNTQYKRRQQEIYDSADKLLQEDFKKYVKKSGFDQKTIQLNEELKKAYSDSWDLAFQNQYKEKVAKTEKLRNDASFFKLIGGLAGFGTGDNKTLEFAYTSFGNSLGSSLEAIGEGTGLNWLRLHGKYVKESTDLLSPAKTDEWTDIFDFGNFLQLSSQLGGSMAPSLAATWALTAATGGAGLGIGAQMVAGALAGWAVESTDMANRLYLDTVSSTGNAALGQERADKMWDFQTKMMWTYSLESLPFMGDFWKGLKLFSKSPRLSAAAKILGGGSAEYFTETGLQEYPQGLAEKAIMNNRDAMTYIGEQVSRVGKYVFGNGVYASDQEKKDVEAAYKAFKETAITTGPTFLFGGGGATSGALKAYNEQASIKKEGLAYYQKYVAGEAAPHIQDQQIRRLTMTKGASFAGTMISNLFASGNITLDQRDKLLTTIDKTKTYLENAATQKLDSAQTGVYMTLAGLHENAQAQVEATEDPIMREAAQKKADALKKELTEYIVNKETNLVHISLANGESYLVTTDDLRLMLDTNPDLIGDIADGNFEYNPIGKTETKLQKELFGGIQQRVEEYKSRVQEEIQAVPLTEEEVKLKTDLETLIAEDERLINETGESQLTPEERQQAEEKVTELTKKQELYATKEAKQQQQESNAAINSEEYQGTTEGQQEVGQSQGGERSATEQQADSGNRNITGEAQVEQAPISESLKDFGSTLNAINNHTSESGFDANKFISVYDLIDNDYKRSFDGIEITPEEILANAYQRAKSDGSNPKLVNAVEELLTPKAPTTEATTEAAPTEQAEQAPTQESQRPSQTLNPKNVDRAIAEEKDKSPVLAKILNDAKKVLKALGKYGVTVNVHHNPAEYRQAVIDGGGTESQANAKTRGFFLDSNGQIHINVSLNKSDTVMHEGAHPLLEYLIAKNPQAVDALYKQLEMIANFNEGARLAIQFGKNTTDSVEQEKKEAIVQFIASIANGDINLSSYSPSRLTQIKEFIKDFLAKLGLTFDVNITDKDSIVEVARKFTDALNKGREVTVGAKPKKGETETQAATQQAVETPQFMNNYIDENSNMEYRYDKNSSKFKQLEKNGRNPEVLAEKGGITKDRSIKDFNGQTIFFHQPDAAFAGAIYKNGQLLVQGKGGLYYPIVFHKDGFFWASTKTAAESMAKNLNEVFRANGGKILMALTTAPYDKLLSSTTAANAVMDLFISKAFDDNFSISKDQVIQSLVDAANKSAIKKTLITFTKADEKLNPKNIKGEPKLDENGKKQYKDKVVGLRLGLSPEATLEDIKSKISKKLGATESSFGDRKMFVEQLISNMADIIKQDPNATSQFNKLFREGMQNKRFIGTRIPKSTDLKISKANMTQAISEMLTEPMLRDEIDRKKGGNIYAILELNSEVKPVDSLKHESYPKALEAVDKNSKVIVHILKDRVQWSDIAIDPETNELIQEDRFLEVYPTSGVSTTGLVIDTQNVPDATGKKKKGPQFQAAEGFEGVVNGFYSNTENALSQVKQEKMSGNQWITQLLSRGANKEEMQVTGLEQLLKENQSKPLTKTEIGQFLKDNRITVEERVKGEAGSGDIFDSQEAMRLFQGGVEMYGYNPDIDLWMKVEDEQDLIDNYIYWSETPKTGRYRDNKTDTRYEQYQLEGEKENYKEVLVTMPNKFAQEEKRYNELLSRRSYDELTSDEKTEYFELGRKLRLAENDSSYNMYESSHFDEKNILVHLRMNTRMDADGNKVLFLEEVQSDWGQEGKKKGFQNKEIVQKRKEIESNLQKTKDEVERLRLEYENLKPLSEEEKDELRRTALKIRQAQMEVRNNRDFEALEEEYNKVYEKQNEYENKRNILKSAIYELRYKGDNSVEYLQYELEDFDLTNYDAGIKNAPFVTDTNAWTKLGLKVALKEAIKQGVSKIAWTTGEQQNQRYDLTKNVDSLNYVKDSSSTYEVIGIKDGKITFRVNKFTEKELEDNFGKDVANRIINDEGVVKPGYAQKELTGEALSVGGKGMKGFYGSPTEGNLGILGNVAKSLFKQTPGTIEINNDKASRDRAIQTAENNDMLSAKDREKLINDLKSGQGKGSTQASIDITPELKAQVNKGLPQFQAVEETKWEESRLGRGDRAITERNDKVKNAAENLYQGLISMSEYNRIVDENSPIKPITQFIKPANERDIRTAVGIKSEGKINLDFPEGEKVALRLDIPAYIGNNIWAITVHEPGKNGSPLSYNNVARIKNVEFTSNPKAALDIARHKMLDTGRLISKGTIARMQGEWIPIEGNTSEAKGKTAMKMVDIINDNPEWSQVGMNPFRHSYFYDRATGNPVVGASELIQIGGLVYAKNIVTTSKNDPQFTVTDKNGNPILDSEGAAIQFQSVEETPQFQGTDDSNLYGNEKIRAVNERVAQRFEADGRSVEAAIMRETGVYRERKQIPVFNAAQAIVADLGSVEAAMEYARDYTVPGDIRTAIFGINVKQKYLAQQANDSTANTIALTQALDLFAVNSTDLGQAVSMVKQVYSQMPELFLKFNEILNTAQIANQLGDINIPGTTANGVREVGRAAANVRKSFINNVIDFYAGNFNAENFFGKGVKSLTDRARRALNQLTTIKDNINPEGKKMLSELLKDITDRGIFALGDTSEQARRYIKENLNNLNATLAEDRKMTDAQIDDFTNALADLYEEVAEDQITKAANRILGNPTTRAEVGRTNKAVRAVMYGSLEDSVLLNKFAQKFGLLTITPALQANLTNLARQWVNARGAVAKAVALSRFNKAMQRAVLNSQSGIAKAYGYFTLGGWLFEAMYYNTLLFAINTFDRAAQGNIQKTVGRMAFSLLRGDADMIGSSVSDTFQSRDFQYEYVDEFGNTINTGATLNQTLDNIYSSLRGLPRLSEIKRSGLNDVEQLIRESKSKTQRRLARTFLAPATRVMSAVDSLTTPINETLTKKQAYYEFIKDAYKAAGISVPRAFIVQQVNDIVGADADTVKRAMGIARADIISGQLFADLGFTDANQFPNSDPRKSSPLSKEAKVYNEWIQRVYEILDDEETARLERIAAANSWLGTIDPSGISKTINNYASKVTSEMTFLGVPRGSLAGAAVAIGNLSNNYPALKYIGVTPLFVNASMNAVSLLVKVTPGFNLVQYLKYLRTGSRGSWKLISPENGKKEYDVPAVVRLDQQQMLTTVVATTGVMVTALGMLSSIYKGDDDEEERAIINHTWTGLTNVKLTPLQEKYGYQPGKFYYKGKIKLDYKDSGYMPLFSAIAFLSNKDIWSNNPMSDKFFVEEPQEDLMDQIGNYVLWSVATMGETSTLRDMSKTTYDLMALMQPQTDEEDATTTKDKLWKIFETKMANTARIVIPYARLQQEGKAVYDALTGANKKIGFGFAQKLSQGMLWEDWVLNSNNTDYFGRPIKETFKLVNPIMSSHILGDLFEGDQYTKLMMKNNYAPKNSLNQLIPVTVNAADMGGFGSMALKDLYKKMKNASEKEDAKIKNVKIDTEKSVEGREAKMVTYSMFLEPQEAHMINQKKGEFAFGIIKESMNGLSGMEKEDFHELMNLVYSMGRNIAIYQNFPELIKNDRAGWYQRIVNQMNDFEVKTSLYPGINWPLEYTKANLIGETPELPINKK